MLDNFSPHLSTKIDQRVGQCAAANNVELAYTPTYTSWLNRIEAQFQALRYFALDGTDHDSHREQASKHDSPIHPLAQPQRARPSTTRACETRKRCLTRHQVPHPRPRGLFALPAQRASR